MKSLSIVAGIIDRGGGLRIVFDDPRGIQGHVGDGERLIIVPGLEVDEDHTGWDDQLSLVDKVIRYIRDLK
jgi:hypothetical protein